MVEPQAIKVKFWGVRGSYPAPGANTLGFGGNTPCVEVQADGWTIILDAGTGIIPLGRDLARRSFPGVTSQPLVLLLSHLHHDHIQGLPFFNSAYLPSNQLWIAGYATKGESDLEAALACNVKPPFFPLALRQMAAVRSIRSLQGGETLLLGKGEPAWKNPGEVLKHHEKGVVVRTLRLSNHPDGVMAYRVEWRGASLVYATDSEGDAAANPELVAFARGAGLLIHDAQYSQAHYNGQEPGYPSTRGWGHSTVEMACSIASAAQVRLLALFHHEPSYEDGVLAANQALARKILGYQPLIGSPERALSAYEGLEIQLERDTGKPLVRPRLLAALQSGQSGSAWSGVGI